MDRSLFLRFALVGAIAASTILSGCAGSPLRISMAVALADDEDLEDYSLVDLVRAWNETRADKVRRELERRRAFTDDEWALIEKKQIRIGMREVALLASWGYPTHINTTTTSHGASRQFVYDRYPKDAYVYGENGIVRTIQN